MISKTILNFLHDLSENNNKEWFQANKARYEIAKNDFVHVTEFLIHQISQFDKTIKGLTVKDCTYRIFRDVRFSNDKTPYKTNFGAFVVKHGKKSGNAGYYFHVEPQNCFLSGGIYMPPSPVLKAVRDELYTNIDEFIDILDKKEFKQNFKSLAGEKLVNPPKGYPKDFKYIEFLKHKHFYVFKEFSEAEFMSDGFLNKAVDVFELLFPFISFINYSIEVTT